MIDLHLHTYYSDGTFSPTEVVQRAVDAGLSAISITDTIPSTDCKKPSVLPLKRWTSSMAWLALSCTSQYQLVTMQ